MKMQKEKINYFFLVRIRPKGDDDTPDQSYTAFWRAIQYNRDIGKPFLHHEDSDHPTYLEDRYLFSDVTYRSKYDGDEYTEDYTNTKRYSLQAGEEFDPPEGINICAKHNITFYQEARNRWNELKEQAREGPVSSRLQNLIDYHERLVGDCIEWFRERFPQYRSQLTGISQESEKTAYARFEELVRLALNAGPQSDDELWEWKRRFDEFSDKKSYFCRYEDRNEPLNQGQGAGNGLEWRTNNKFRRRKRKKSNLRT